MRLSKTHLPKGARTLILVIAAALVYGFLNAYSSRLLLPSAPFIALRPQVALPFFLGFVFGPWVGFLTGFLGNMIGDGLSGYGYWHFWNWHIANGIYGLLPGFAHYFGLKEIRTLRRFVIMETVVVATNVIAVGFAVLTDLLWLKIMQFPESLNSWILPALITNIVLSFVLVPLLLVFVKSIVITVETRITLALSWLMVSIVVISATAVTWTVWNDLTSQAASVRAFYSAGIVTVLVVMVGFLISVFLARRITDPLTSLSEAARQIENGEYRLPVLDTLGRRSDEFGQLSTMMRRMANQVELRETRLKDQVAELKIEIDRTKQDEDVREIVESDYFKTLRQKARGFRTMSRIDKEEEIKDATPKDDESSSI
ncbi:MAG: ECF transporter S component [Deltaproteobacteria bacterium]|nr:ECF transporter S component [Deltaproteobacteria bacterium]